MASSPSRMVPHGIAGTWDGLGRHGHLRSSQEDREYVIELLKAAFAEGRLEHDELADRVGRVYGSRTYAELAAVTGDLPAGELLISMLRRRLPRPPARSQASAEPRAGNISGITVQSVRPRAGSAAACAQVSGLAIASGILGIGGFLTDGITSVFALIIGVVALPRLASAGEKGGAFVFLGIVLGLIGTLCILLPELLMGRLLP
jgi:hypothetical protein